MLFSLLRKEKNIKSKKRLIISMIKWLKISSWQKNLYLESIEVLDENWLNELYNTLTDFVENHEIKEIENIKKESFSSINWMRKKEAKEKQEDLNSFNFLLNNI